MQELEKILEEIRKIGNIQFSSYTKPLIAVEDVEKIICKHMNAGWIPVEERLPENDEFVLVTVDGIYNSTTFSYAIQLASYYKDDGWIIEGYPDWEDSNVSAWLPLPEPYRQNKQRRVKGVEEA